MSKTKIKNLSILLSMIFASLLIYVGAINGIWFLPVIGLTYQFSVLMVNIVGADEGYRQKTTNNILIIRRDENGRWMRDENGR